MVNHQGRTSLQAQNLKLWEFLRRQIWIEVEQSMQWSLEECCQQSMEVLVHARCAVCSICMQMTRTTPPALVPLTCLGLSKCWLFQLLLNWSWWIHLNCMLKFLFSWICMLEIGHVNLHWCWPGTWDGFLYNFSCELVGLGFLDVLWFRVGLLLFELQDQQVLFHYGGLSDTGR